MNDERWQDLKDKIEQKFGSFDIDKSEDFLEDDLGHQVPQELESLTFKSPLGEIRIKRSKHKKIIDRKSHYHKGAGGSDIEFVVADDEYSFNIEVMKKDDVTGEWEKFDLPPEKISF